MENKSIHQPHDGLFKKSMSDLRVAKDFFQSHLPKNLINNIDLSTLHLENHAFIDASLHRSESDIVYSYKTKQDDFGYFYVLCEHQ
ncbi:MAG: Rpn family recombination-promoting nuclease/putative transposase, partial [Coxiellaceae bacterium]|nr:Rpn family recombination-promoting nuclease/putative transposase [Coxiellaceae bacterium]